MAPDPTVVADGTDSLNFGVGPLLRFDSRAFPQNAYKGVFAQASVVPHLSWKGTHDRYLVFDLDYRHYVTLGREGSTLTWNLRTRTAFGGVPWPSSASSAHPTICAATAGAATGTERSPTAFSNTASSSTPPGFLSIGSLDAEPVF